MSSRALFLDRDGTLVHSSHYPSRPEQLRLYENIGPALGLLQQRHVFRIIVITNQAGIARGYFTEADLQRMHEYLTGELATLGVQVDGIYHCPHHPEGVVEGLSIRCECRKPQPGMLLRAAQDLDIDLAHSWFVGDILDDVEAGNRANCRTVLVDLGTESLPQHPLRVPTFVARNTVHALDIIRHVEETASPDLMYRPPSWLVRQEAVWAEPELKERWQSEQGAASPTAWAEPERKGRWQSEQGAASPTAWAEPELKERWQSEQGEAGTTRG